MEWVGFLAPRAAARLPDAPLAENRGGRGRGWDEVAERQGQGDELGTRDPLVVTPRAPSPQRTFTETT